MLRMLVVDDEFPIRQWFVFCIEKSGRNCRVIGEAQNGKAALDIFKREMPDVVITDIKMPVMDGLEFMKEAKAINPNCDFVILTCHADFEYARQAVKHGAEEYLLKMEITEKDLFELLDRLEKRRMGRENTEKALYQQHQIRMKAFVDTILENRLLNEREIRSELDRAGILLDKNNLFAAAAFINKDSDLTNIDRYIKTELEEFLVNACCFIYNNMFVLLGNLKGIPSQLLLINNLHNLVRRLFELLDCSIGTSMIYQNLEIIGNALEEAINALRQEFYKGERTVTFSFGITEDISANEIKKICKEAEKAASKGDFRALREYLEDFFQLIGKVRFGDIPSIYEMCIAILEKAYDHTAEICAGAGFEKKLLRESIMQIRYLNMLKAYMEETLKTLDDCLALKNTYYSPVVAKAVEYMNVHFQEQLSLSDIARHVHLNPSYLSYLFKKETGENISVFLMMLRLDKAEELLKNTDMKLADIAENVGYPNLSHFSRIFGKYKGTTPLLVRKMR